MGTYVTTNVRLPAAMLKALKRRAVEESTSVAEIIRASISYYLQRHETPNIDYENDTFFAISEGAGDGPRDGAVSHDRYIYGGIRTGQP